MSTGVQRIMEEFKEINRNPISNCGVTVGLFNEGDPTRWRVSLLGPKDTSYKGGLFYLSIIFPSNYPEKAPEVCFLTPIYHVNVNPRIPTYPGGEGLGHVFISQLLWWNSNCKMRELLMDIFALFYMSTPDNPYGLDRAEELRTNRAKYEEKIKYFTKKYANPMSTDKNISRDEDWNFNYP